MTAVQSLSAQLHAQVGGRRIDVEFDTASGILVMIGPNGAGKSSVLSLLLGVLPMQSGRVAIGSLPLFDSRRAVDVPTEGRQLGYVPQEYALFPHLTVKQNVAFALSMSRAGATSASQQGRLQSIIGELGLEALGDRLPHTLSGGEKQRVALARALSVAPRALLLDEPLAALDVHARREVRVFLRDYLVKLALPTLLVTHDPHDARYLADSIVVLEQGQVTQTGTWQELVARPATQFVERFVAVCD